jgi:hypothetical protein
MAHRSSELARMRLRSTIHHVTQLLACVAVSALLEPVAARAAEMRRPAITMGPPADVLAVRGDVVGDAQTDRQFNFNQNQPYDNLGRYMGYLGGEYGNTTTQPLYNSNTGNTLGLISGGIGLASEYGGDVFNFLKGIF